MAGHAGCVQKMRVKGVSRGLTNSPLDCWSPGCGRVGLFDSSSLQSKMQPPWRDTPWGLLFGAGEGSRTLVLSLEG